MPKDSPEHPVALTIAGFDTSAGAGLQADLLTFHNHGYHCLTAATSIVVETPLQVRRTEAISDELLLQQVELLLSTYPVAAIKVGLLASTAQALLLGEILGGQTVPIVLDPVGISSTGSTLQAPGTSDAVMAHLAPLATLITPNLPEARTLTGASPEETPDDVARELSRRTGQAVLLTGGHHDNNLTVRDFLCHDQEEHSFTASLIETPASLHGTGCVLSSAIAAQLGLGENLRDAIEGGRRYLREAMKNHLRFANPSPLLALNHCQQGRHDQ